MIASLLKLSHNDALFHTEAKIKKKQKTTNCYAEFVSYIYFYEIGWDRPIAHYKWGEKKKCSRLEISHLPSFYLTCTDTSDHFTCKMAVQEVSLRPKVWIGCQQSGHLFPTYKLQ